MNEKRRKEIRAYQLRIAKIDTFGPCVVFLFGAAIATGGPFGVMIGFLFMLAAVCGYDRDRERVKKYLNRHDGDMARLEEYKKWYSSLSESQKIAAIPRRFPGPGRLGSVRRQHAEAIRRKMNE